MNGITLTDPTDIKRFHMTAQLKALRLEIMGFKHSKGSVYAHIKRTYGFTGDRHEVANQLHEMIQKL